MMNVLVEMMEVKQSWMHRRFGSYTTLSLVEVTFLAYDLTGSVEDLRHRILAVYYHTWNTTLVPINADCPPERDSGVGTMATGEVATSFTSKNFKFFELTTDLLGRVLRVFTSFTQPSLLSRCLRKETKNQNESLSASFEESA